MEVYPIKRGVDGDRRYEVCLKALRPDLESACQLLRTSVSLILATAGPQKLAVVVDYESAADGVAPTCFRLNGTDTARDLLHEHLTPSDIVVVIRHHPLRGTYLLEVKQARSRRRGGRNVRVTGGVVEFGQVVVVEVEKANTDVFPPVDDGVKQGG